MVIFYKKWKKYNEFQLTKNKMDLNIQKITSSTLPRKFHLDCNDLIYLKTFSRRFRNEAFNSGRWTRLVCRAPKRKKEEVPFKMTVGNRVVV